MLSFSNVLNNLSVVLSFQVLFEEISWEQALDCIFRRYCVLYFMFIDRKQLCVIKSNPALRVAWHCLFLLFEFVSLTL